MLNGKYMKLHFPKTTVKKWPYSAYLITICFMHIKWDIL